MPSTKMRTDDVHSSQLKSSTFGSWLVSFGVNMQVIVTIWSPCWLMIKGDWSQPSVIWGALWSTMINNNDQLNHVNPSNTNPKMLSSTIINWKFHSYTSQYKLECQIWSWKVLRAMAWPVPPEAPYVNAWESFAQLLRSQHVSYVGICEPQPG